MSIHLIVVHHQFSGPDVPDDTGPARLADAGLADMLAREGHAVDTRAVMPADFENERDAVAFLTRSVAEHARVAANTDFVLTLGGSCVTCLGALAALPEQRAGLIWIDAHGDFNTPETSPSGMLNGMPLAIASGRCHRDILDPIRSRPVAEAAIVLIGARDIDPDEAEALAGSEVNVLQVNDIAEGAVAALADPLERLAAVCDAVYIHVDMDGIDPDDAPGVGSRTPGGVAEADVVAIIRTVGKRLRIRAAGIAEYDPRFDENGKTRELCARIARELARAARGAS